MRICIVAEGSYPYVTGGVASWIQTLITCLPEFEFIIFAIGASEKDKGQFKYVFPPNLIYVKEVFLDSFKHEDSKWGSRMQIQVLEKQALKDLLMGEECNWSEIFNFLDTNRHVSVTEFLMSKDYFDMVKEVCMEKYPEISFNEYFWTIRSMILPLFEVMRSDMPPADIYHAVSTGYAGIMASFAKYLTKTPLVLTEHGIYTREREEEIIKSEWVKGHFKDTWIDYFYNLSNCAYGYADIVISLFERSRELQVELSCNNEKTRVIANGIRVEDFKDLSIKEDDDIINVGALVRIVPIKDLKTMIQAFAMACRERMNLKLYIMGPVEEDEEYWHECEALVQSFELENVVFTGKVSIKDYIGRMDVLLLSSISEGQPLAVLEGMAASKPFVVTDVGSCKELIYGNDDGFGDAGIVVPVMDFEAMGQAIVQLCKSLKQREILGANGFKRVSALYRLDDLIREYRELYTKLALG